MKVKTHGGAVVGAGIALLVIAALVAGGLGGLGGRSAPAAIPQTCPAVRGTPVEPILSQARKHFVPFPPTEALLCLYALDSSAAAPGGAPAPSRQVRIDAAAAARLAGDFDAAARSSAGVVSCGPDVGDVVDAYFQGDGESIEVLITGLPGCSWATNGPKSADIGNSEVVPEVQGLLGLDSWPGIPG